ncbi:MAG: hypothetical protein ACRDT4_11790, partial [Micromonosporaceae bacterium]
MDHHIRQCRRCRAFGAQLAGTTLLGAIYLAVDAAQLAPPPLNLTSRAHAADGRPGLLAATAAGAVLVLGTAAYLLWPVPPGE